MGKKSGKDEKKKLWVYRCVFVRGRPDLPVQYIGRISDFIEAGSGDWGYIISSEVIRHANVKKISDRTYPNLDTVLFLFAVHRFWNEPGECGSAKNGRVRNRVGPEQRRRPESLSSLHK